MRIAFVGGWGHVYLRKLLSGPQFAIEQSVAVASDGIDADAARRLASNLGVPTVWFDRVEDLLEQYRPDVVNVGAVYGYAGDVSAKVLAAGVPVVTDKPPAATWTQLTKLRSFAKNNARLITEFDFRSKPEFRSARDAVAAGLIGDVVLATAQKSYRFGQRPEWYGDRKAYAGTVMWVASHGIDAVTFVTGQTFSKVTGRRGNLSHPELPEMDDHTVNLFALTGGGSAAVHSDLLRPSTAPSHGDDRLRVIGSKGQLEIRDGVCKLITSEVGETDISKRVSPKPIGEELLDAALGKDDRNYSTDHSLAMAEILLHARDAADREEWIDCLGWQ